MAHRGKIDNFEDLKKSVEAVLFAAGRRMKLSEIAKVVKQNEEDVKSALVALMDDYQKNDSPMIILEEGEYYKMTVRERYLGYVKKIVPKTDMSKSVMETLATIAWKAPVLQSEVIRIRTNKAYDHIDQLEEAGFISKKKQGKSYLIMLTQKFYDYFDIESEGELKKAFKRIDEIAKKSKLAEEQDAEMKKAVSSMEVYTEDGKEKEIRVVVEPGEPKKPEAILFIDESAVESEPQKLTVETQKRGESEEENKIIERMLSNKNQEVKDQVQSETQSSNLNKSVTEIEEGAKNLSELNETLLEKEKTDTSEHKKKAKLDLFEGEEEQDEEDSELEALFREEGDNQK
ncbi:MAG: SMC-Scp complex subunit ScpB [Candidatus Woesearchaeota archaeon]